MTVSVPTLLLVVIVMSAVLAVSIAVLARRQSRELMVWAWAIGIHSLAYVLYALRGQVDDFWSVVVANVGIATTLALFRLGIANSQGRRPPWRRIAWPVLGVAFSFSVWLGNPPLRVIAGCSIFALQSLDCLLALQRQRGHASLGQYFLMAGLCLTTLVFLVRVAAMLGGYLELPSILDSNRVQVASFVVVIAALVLFGAGLTLTVLERTVHELAQSRGQLSRQHMLLQQYSSELEAANLRLGELSMTDSLTGLGNRRRFDEALALEWARARRLKKPLALLMVDVDCFKLYNDHYGHQAGDDCLVRVAAVLQSQLRRAGDLATRYGGEEFALIAFDTGREGVEKLAEKLCRAVSELRISHDRVPQGRVTVSIGAAVVMPRVTIEPDELVRRADAALYRAKGEGRNCVRLCDSMLAGQRAPS